MEMAIAIEVMQVSFMGLTSAILVLESRAKKRASKRNGKIDT
jgi:hypothetical protein